MHSALRQRMSRVFQRLDEIISHVATGRRGVVRLDRIHSFARLKGFPPRWQMGFSTVANAIVIMLLFALKHTQDRQQTALQLKLDELIRSSPRRTIIWSNRTCRGEELVERVRDQIEVHDSLRSDDGVDKK